MINNYIEVQVAAMVDAGELLAHLPSSGVIGAWEGDGIIYLYWPGACWSPRVMEDLEAAIRRLGVHCHAADIRIHEVADRDWNALWVDSIRPVQIGTRVLVRQSWNAVTALPGVLELIIDPKRAFGSGYHATTQLLVEWIVEEIRGGERVLDIGTGSGILAMTALRSGASLVVGIDSDASAIECARENAVLNGFGEELELRTGSIESIGSTRFELIVANIDRKTLLGCAGILGKNLSRGGKLLLSGLQGEDLGDMSEVLQAAGGRVIGERRRDEWVALEVEFEPRLSSI